MIRQADVALARKFLATTWFCEKCGAYHPNDLRGDPGEHDRLSVIDHGRMAAALIGAVEDVEQLDKRQQELLVTIRNLSATTPYPEEAGNAAALIAEVGTLKAKLAELRRVMSRCPIGYVDGRLISTRSTTDADVIAWLQELVRIVE